MSNKRATTVGILTAGIAASILATTVGPAAAQGNPVGGKGNAYFLSGAVNTTGVAQSVYAYGNVDDQVYYGDWFGTGEDTPMVRRANIYYVTDPSGKALVFAYGDANDEVLVGNWDGKGADLNGDTDMTDTNLFGITGLNEATAETDSLAVRRGNHFYVKNDSFTTGKADSEFFYGDAGDKVLVGNWDAKVTANVAGVDNSSPADGDFTDKGSPAYASDLHPTGIDNSSPADGDFIDAGDVAPDPGFNKDAGDGSYNEPGDRKPGTGVDNNGDGDFNDPAALAVVADIAPKPGKGDTLMIQRGNQFFVKNSISTGIADYTFYYGDAGDTVMVGDWATPAQGRVGATAPKRAVPGDGADQIVVRRGNVYFSSTELQAAREAKTNPTASRVFAYGDVNDTVFVASLPSLEVDEFGQPVDNDGTTAGLQQIKIAGDGLGVRR